MSKLTKRISIPIVALQEAKKVWLARHPEEEVNNFKCYEIIKFVLEEYAFVSVRR